MTVSDLPLVNATLNSICTCLLVAGWWFIKHERKQQHIICMLAALATSALFLITYVTHKILVQGVHTKFGGEGAWVPVYYTLLISHLILAMAIVPLVLLTVIPALRARYDRHRKMARWTLPIWLYVSVTGVLVYLFLYVWFPSSKVAGA